MYRILELTLHKDMMALFAFLKDNPSRVLRRDGYYKLLYYEPLDEYFTPFIYRLVALQVVDNDPTETLFAKGWEFVRNLDIRLAGQQLITELRELEQGGSPTIKCRVCLTKFSQHGIKNNLKTTAGVTKRVVF